MTLLIILLNQYDTLRLSNSQRLLQQISLTIMILKNETDTNETNYFYGTKFLPRTISLNRMHGFYYHFQAVFRIRKIWAVLRNRNYLLRLRFRILTSYGSCSGSGSGSGSVPRPKNFFI
jgi:hypothetical protein